MSLNWNVVIRLLGQHRRRESLVIEFLHPFEKFRESFEFDLAHALACEVEQIADGGEGALTSVGDVEGACLGELVRLQAGPGGAGLCSYFTEEGMMAARDPGARSRTVHTVAAGSRSGRWNEVSVVVVVVTDLDVVE